jgi:ABC-2 type transport system permease protein
MLRKALRVAAKEFTGFFASPAAVLFLAAFLGVTLFVFFWVAAFFQRNIADVRPLFQWMPVLLIFLVAALTMRAWAEERRSGTLELLLTSPTTPTEYVLGKFLGCMGLVLVALALTLPLPIIVSLLGPLDWGPVIGGYAAAILLAAAYVAIGLTVSCRTDNQIVSLIVTVLITGAFYLIGSNALTALVGYRAGEWLHALGAGSRFASITRGVLDLRDLYYYLSITAAFLLFNRLALEQLRWAGNRGRPGHRRWYWLTALLAANLLGANLWLSQIGGARLDLTAGRLYTLSEVTRSDLAVLQEPLLIRGYFSASTHPLLAPLVPQLRDLLEEYAVAGHGKVRVEFVDPHEDPKVEAEAASRYGIRPVPFQVSSKYQASVVNSYFDVLVSYGDQYQVLNYRDLIDIKVRGDSDLDVELKNPEYALTSAIHKAMLSYQGGGNVFDTLPRALTFTGYISSAQSLPPELQQVRAALDGALQQIDHESSGKLKVQLENPDANSALATRLTRDFGFRPMVLSLTDPKSFWFYMTLSDGRQTEALAFPEKHDQAGFKAAIEAGVKRFSPGFLKTLAVMSPSSGGESQQFGPGRESYSVLRDALSSSVRWLDTDLKSGRVPSEADMLVLLDPVDLDAKQVFAVDQFLMEGGTVLIATSPMQVAIEQSILARPVTSGLGDWLATYGLGFGKGLVLDRQSGALPIPVQRDVGGVSVNELELANYPYIIDVRGRGLDPNSPVTANLGQLDVPWAAPLVIDARRNMGRKLSLLLRSSNDSWTSAANDLLPNYRSYPDLGFSAGRPLLSQPLAVMLEGEFDSAYRGKSSPLLSQPEPAAAVKPTAATTPGTGEDATPAAGAPSTPASVIEHSPDSARLILVGSSALFSDQVAELLGEALGTRYLKPVEFAQNLVDWSLQDQGLMSIRGRGHFARTLVPMSRGQQQFWEYLNYALALGGLALVWALYRRRRRRLAVRHMKMLQET